MLTHPAEWQAWEDEQARREPVDFSRNLAVMEALREHAVQLDVWGNREPLEGLEAK